MLYEVITGGEGENGEGLEHMAVACPPATHRTTLPGLVGDRSDSPAGGERAPTGRVAAAIAKGGNQHGEGLDTLDGQAVEHSYNFV